MPSKDHLMSGTGLGMAIRHAMAVGDVGKGVATKDPALIAKGATDAAVIGGTALLMTVSAVREIGAGAAKPPPPATVAVKDTAAKAVPTATTGGDPIGFAPGEGASAFTPDRLQHASAHLTKAGILPNWGKATGEQFTKMGAAILEHPTATFDHTLKGPAPVKGFVGQVNGQTVAILVYKSGARAGTVATAIVPSAEQLAGWGIK